MLQNADVGLSMSKVNAGIACLSNATHIPQFNLRKAREIESKQHLIFQYLHIFILLIRSLLPGGLGRGLLVHLGGLLGLLLRHLLLRLR